jgi:serine/threonine-protein kinase HipA
MTDALIVILDGQVAGTLLRVARGRLRFDYDDTYCNRSDPTPLSVSMPTRSHHTPTTSSARG